MRNEGIYTYFCSICETFFGVVARFWVSGDRQQLFCPKCSKPVVIYGEGVITYEIVNQQAEVKLQQELPKTNDSGYPVVLDANHVKEIMKVSKRVAYEMMERKDFPLIRIGRLKRVNRDAFFDWLNESR